ncbi:centromere DNA-binding protein complex CBF3 subunit, domain 2 domain-containing protein [Hirsutella rhossiliensis]
MPLLKRLADTDTKAEAGETPENRRISTSGFLTGGQARKETKSLTDGHGNSRVKNGATPCFSLEKSLQPVVGINQPSTVVKHFRRVTNREHALSLMATSTCLFPPRKLANIARSDILGLFQRPLSLEVVNEHPCWLPNGIIPPPLSSARFGYLGLFGAVVASGNACIRSLAANDTQEKALRGLSSKRKESFGVTALCTRSVAERGLPNYSYRSSRSAGEDKNKQRPSNDKIKIKVANSFVYRVVVGANTSIINWAVVRFTPRYQKYSLSDAHIEAAPPPFLTFPITIRRKTDIATRALIVVLRGGGKSAAEVTALTGTSGSKMPLVLAVPLSSLQSKMRFSRSNDYMASPPLSRLPEDEAYEEARLNEEDAKRTTSLPPRLKTLQSFNRSFPAFSLDPVVSSLVGLATHGDVLRDRRRVMKMKGGPLLVLTVDDFGGDLLQTLAYQIMGCHRSGPADRPDCGAGVFLVGLPPSDGKIEGPRPGALRETFDFGLAHAQDPRVRAAIEHYLLDLENTQPKNTKRNYPRMRALQSSSNWPAIPDVWPASVPQGQQLPGDLVDEGKLLLFMKEKGKRVADERKRHLEAQEAKRAVKRRRAPSAHHTNTQLPPADTIVVGGGGSEYESDSDLELYESTLKLQYNTVRGYVSAIQKLYDEQKSRESILRPGHRSGTEGAQTQHSCNDLEPEEEGIHGQGSWNSQRCVCAGADTRPHQQIACALRTQVDFLLGNHMLLRSGNRLPMELADCFPLDLPNEGCKAQGYTTKALTNQHGRMEYGSALRHRDPRSCLIGALAFWLFWRWQVEKAERFPVFQRSEDWYETKVLRRSAKEPQGKRDGIHRNPKTQRVHRPFHSPNIQLQWTSRFYKKAGIKVSKWMKARHVICPRQAAPTPWPGLTRTIQIRRAGRWNNGDQMTGCYLTSLPFEFMRASGSYFVPRATVRPPVVLLVQVWPQLDKWKEAHSSPFSDLGVEQNMAAGAFLELLEWLREVLLQDAVFLRESYPDHPIFQDPVFSCPEFEAFASKVQDTCTRDHEDSHTTVIQKAMPVVAEKLRTVLTQQVAAEQLAERRHLDLLGASYELCTKLDEFAQATYTVTFSPGQGAAGQHAEIAGAHQQRRRAPRETVLRSEIGPSQAGGPAYAPLSLEQQQGMVQAGQGQAQGRAHGEALWISEKGHKRASGQFNVGGSEKSMAQMTRTLAAKVPQAVRAASLHSSASRLENASNHRNLATDRMLSSRTGFLVVGPGFRALWRSEDDINPAEVIRTCDIHLMSNLATLNLATLNLATLNLATLNLAVLNLLADSYLLLLLSTNCPHSIDMSYYDCLDSVLIRYYPSSLITCTGKKSTIALSNVSHKPATYCVSMEEHGARPNNTAAFFFNDLPDEYTLNITSW